MRRVRDAVTANDVPVIKEIREAPVKSFPTSLDNWLATLAELRGQLLDVDSSSPLVTNGSGHVHLYRSLNEAILALDEVHPGGLSSLRREFRDLWDQKIE